MDTSKILNLVLAIVLVVLSVKITFIDSGKDDGQTAGQQCDTAGIVINNIMTRTSIRDYTSQQVEKEKVETILKAGMAAPTAKNSQPWSFVVVDSRDQLQKISEAMHNAKMTAKASFAIVVCGNMDKAMTGAGREYWIQDVSAVSENILLAAHGLGLGAVWTGVYPVQERMQSITTILALPESQIPFCVIPVGYPAESPLPKDKWNPANIHYNTWQQ